MWRVLQATDNIVKVWIGFDCKLVNLIFYGQDFTNIEKFILAEFVYIVCIHSYIGFYRPSDNKIVHILQDFTDIENIFRVCIVFYQMKIFQISILHTLKTLSRKACKGYTIISWRQLTI